jgi:formylglycine-generating enzyme required for sulfatase activity
MRRVLLVGFLAAGCGGGDGSAADAGGGGDAAATSCQIDGQTYADGEANPEDACLKCDAAAAAGAWSPNDGARCGDGLFCTGADYCSGGTCSVHAGPDCLVCDEDNNACLANPWLAIPAGTFTMGSPPDEVGRESNFVDETAHEVTLTRAFEMTATAVTQDQFRAVMGYNPSQFNACGGDCPVDAVNFYEALAFANLTSEAAGLPPCYQLTDIVCGDDSAGSAPSYCRDNGLIKDAAVALTATTPYDCAGYRLPTEAEREYATRAGTTTAFSDGGGLDEAHIDCATPFPLTAIAWYCGNGGGTTHPVGLRVANPWGLYDMHGNLHEWTWDWYADYPADPVSDPAGPAEGTQRTYRGGAWGDSARYSRSATRSQMEPNFRYPGNLGFRLARTSW